MSVSFVSRPSVESEKVKNMKHHRLVLAVNNLFPKLFWRSVLSPLSRTVLVAVFLNLAIAPNVWAGKPATSLAPPSSQSAVATPTSQINLPDQGNQTPPTASNIHQPP